jgi:tRNA/tmRNA/rRNA uracil-C5-methylase (TrmA/RlmC/RlmD family)
MSRATRPHRGGSGSRPARGASLLELEIGRVAAGGACVATAPDGRVVFVRHTLPGEKVRARVTESTKRFLRADAVEILEPSPDRVVQPCRYARPGRCGGCDFQHVALPAQRRLKAEATRDQLRRLGGLDEKLVDELVVEELPPVLPGNAEGLRWRTRAQFAVREDGRSGLHRYRSHNLEPVDTCPITAAAIEETGVLRERWPGRRRLELAASPSHPEDGVSYNGDRTLHFEALGRRFRVSEGGFWQVHPAAADVLAEAVLEALAPTSGERALDLYAGAGLFSAALAQAGATVCAVESFLVAAGDARENLGDLRVEVVTGAVEDTIADLAAGNDLVVLDPPRTGAGVAVMQTLVAARPRAIAYVSCDPATLARDLRAAREAGYRLSALRAFDLFPMTAHVECLAVLEPAAVTPGSR